MFEYSTLSLKTYGLKKGVYRKENEHGGLLSIDIGYRYLYLPVLRIKLSHSIFSCYIVPSNCIYLTYTTFGSLPQHTLSITNVLTYQ